MFAQSVCPVWGGKDSVAQAVDARGRHGFCQAEEGLGVASAKVCKISQPQRQNNPLIIVEKRMNPSDKLKDSSCVFVP